MSDTVPPVFRTTEGKARYLQAYEAVLREWPVPYEEIQIATRLGSTHVVASGPRDAPVRANPIGKTDITLAGQGPTT